MTTDYDHIMALDKNGLRACWCCGGEARDRGSDESDWVECSRCYAGTDVYPARSGKHIEAWNTRSSDALLRKQHELLEKCEEAVLPFVEMLNGFKEWRGDTTKAAHPKHIPVLRVTWPADKQSAHFRELYVSDFAALSEALALLREGRD